MADDGYEIREIGPGVCIREGVDNCVWADLGSGTLVIDTLEDKNAAEIIKGAVQQTVGKPIQWIINTHWDEDHITGNPTLAREGATVIAHETCAAKSEAKDGSPDITYREGFTLDGQSTGGFDRDVIVEWLGGTHTPADSIVYLTWAKVLHVADLFGWGLMMQRGDTPEKSARTREALDRIMTYDADVVVCGHGPTLTMNHIRRYRDYFDWLWTVVPTLVNQGKGVEEIQKEIPVPEDMKDWWRLEDWKHNRNIERIVDAQIEQV